MRGFVQESQSAESEGGFLQQLAVSTRLFMAAFLSRSSFVDFENGFTWNN